MLSSGRKPRCLTHCSFSSCGSSAQPSTRGSALFRGRLAQVGVFKGPLLQFTSVRTMTDPVFTGLWDHPQGAHGSPENIGQDMEAG